MCVSLWCISWPCRFQNSPQEVKKYVVMRLMELLQLKESWNKENSAEKSLGHWAVLLPWTAYIVFCTETQWTISTLSSGLRNSPTKSQEAQTPESGNACNDDVQQMQLPSKFQSHLLTVGCVTYLRLGDRVRHVISYLTLALGLKTKGFAFLKLDWVLSLVLVGFATGCLGNTSFIFCSKTTVQMWVPACERVEMTGEPRHGPCGRQRHSQTHCAAAESLGTKRGWLCSSERT